MGILYVDNHPEGEVFLFPPPLAVPTVRLVLILHPQRIQRTEVCVRSKRILSSVT